MTHDTRGRLTRLDEAILQIGTTLTAVGQSFFGRRVFAVVVAVYVLSAYLLIADWLIKVSHTAAAALLIFVAVVIAIPRLTALAGRRSRR
jgi:hypothetical protein